MMANLLKQSGFLFIFPQNCTGTLSAPEHRQLLHTCDVIVKKVALMEKFSTS